MFSEYLFTYKHSFLVLFRTFFKYLQMSAEKLVSSVAFLILWFTCLHPRTYANSMVPEDRLIDYKQSRTSHYLAPSNFRNIQLHGVFSTVSIWVTCRERLCNLFHTLHHSLALLCVVWPCSHFWDPAHAFFYLLGSIFLLIPTFTLLKFAVVRAKFSPPCSCRSLNTRTF